jgi:hypothetical protein
VHACDIASPCTFIALTFVCARGRVEDLVVVVVVVLFCPFVKNTGRKNNYPSLIREGLDVFALQKETVQK